MGLLSFLLGFALTGLTFEELRRYNVCVAVPPGHALAGSGQVALRVLAKEQLVGYTRADYPEYHEWLNALFAPLGRGMRSVEEHDSATSLIAAVESGRGVALVPQSFACFVGARLKLLPLTPAPPAFEVGVVRKKGASGKAGLEFVVAAKRPVAENV